MRIATQRRLLASSILAASAIVSPALAQDAQSASPAAAAEEEEIVVTAQKRSERLQDVPISITAIDDDMLRDNHIQQLKDIAEIAPGLQFQQAGAFTQPMIRGVGTSIVSPGAGTNVGVYVDGFLLPNPLVTDQQFLNVQSVQVLKGPQGTLFGRNTTGGAILLTTSEPSTTTAGRAEISYGSFNAFTYQAYATGGLGDRLAVDFAGLISTGEGYVRNLATGKKDSEYDNWSFRAGAKLTLTDNFSLLLRYSHTTVDDPSSQPSAVLCCNANGLPLALASYIPGAVVGTGPGVRATAPLSPSFRMTSDAVQLTATLDLGFGTLKSYSQYRNEVGTTVLDLDASTMPIVTLRFPYWNKIFTQEVVATSNPGSRLQWTVGAYYFRDRASNQTDQAQGGLNFVPALRLRVTVESLAAYADVTYEVVDGLFLTGGIRYGSDKYKNARGLAGPDPTPFAVNFDPLSEDTITPRVVARFEIARNTSVYASFNRGYKSGIRNIAGFSNRPVEPEEINAYEVGFKHAGRGFSVNLAGYYYDYKNLQVSSYFGTTAITSNAATSRIYGAEASFTARLSPQFELSGGAAYTDAKYKRYVDAPVFVQCLNVLTCGAAFGTFPTAFATLTDSPMQFAPKFSGHLSGRYATPLAGGEFSLAGTISYTSKQYFDSAALFANTAHENLTLRAQWTDPSERFTFAVYGDNLTDKRYIAHVAPQALAIRANWNAPRTFGAMVGFKF